MDEKSRVIVPQKLDGKQLPCKEDVLPLQKQKQKEQLDGYIQQLARI
ncbi:MAG: hypothetical protein WBZ36_08450 [Candidatus Nitrosopolaris sp.]